MADAAAKASAALGLGGGSGERRTASGRGSRPGTLSSRPGSVSRPGSRHKLRNWEPNAADSQFLSGWLERWEKNIRHRELAAGWFRWLELLRTFRTLQARRQRTKMHANFLRLLGEHKPGGRVASVVEELVLWCDFTGVFGDVGRDALRLLCQNMRLRRYATVSSRAACVKSACLTTPE